MAVVSLNTNVASLSAQRRLAEGSWELSRTYERLSTGLRINHASDDAAGLSIVSQLSADSRVYTQGIRNINDGLSALNIAQGSVGRLSDILQRMRELATQSANGVLGRSQRLSEDEEAYALTNEFNRILSSTAFNGLHILNSDFGGLRIQGGKGIDESTFLDTSGSLERKVGTGEFSDYQSFANPVNEDAVAVADLNGDGKKEFLNSDYNGYVRIYSNDGSGNFTLLDTVTNGLANMIAVADFDGDGKADLLTRDVTNELYIRKGNGTGIFSNIAPVDIGYKSDINPLYADLNGDNKLDLVTYYGTSTRILLANGSGGFQQRMTINGFFPGAVGDINGDGKMDLISQVSSTRAALGKGDGTFMSSITLSTTASNSVALGDFNHDGQQDLALATDTDIRLLLNNGGNSFTEQIISGTEAGNGYGNLRAGDFNGDGYTDILAPGGDTGCKLLFGAAGGAFNVTDCQSLAGGSGTYTVADLNNDGVLDLATASKVYLANTTDTSTIQRFDLTTREASLATLDLIDAYSQRVSAELGAIGSAQSRLLAQLENISVRAETYKAAQSRIEDCDVAAESAVLVSQQIKQRAAAAVLAQANQSPQLAIALLQNLRG
jgi:flagellin